MFRSREPEPSREPRLLDRVRDRIRYKHYSIRTEQAYLDWIRRFIWFHDRRHPNRMGAAEVEAYLTHLATVGRVAAATQNQAKSALLFCIVKFWASSCRGWMASRAPSCRSACRWC